MINVTKTYLPDINKYKKYIDEIYASGWVTNNGPMVKKLEKRLAKYLGVKHIVLVSSGTSALEVAYRALNIKDEVITTPFSFVATTSSLVANGLNPVFADIDKDTLNIDTNAIEKNITEKTTAIVPVHIFGNSCNIEKIDEIAIKYNLKVIYDASHAFGVEDDKGKSILSYGDISTLSFHATKLFHTIEGGALVINDDSLVEKVRYLINFGIKDEESIPELGTNAKMNEFEAAMGLCVLDEMEMVKKAREVVSSLYVKELKGLCQFQEQNSNFNRNFSYFPIILKSEEELLNIKSALNKADIYPRRYFFNSLDSLSYIEPKQFCENSRDISKRILCLPLYPELERQSEIIKIIKSNFDS